MTTITDLTQEALCALQELNAIAPYISNENILLHCLGAVEVQHSLLIENLPTSLDDLFAGKNRAMQTQLALQKDRSDLNSVVGAMDFKFRKQPVYLRKGWKIVYTAPFPYQNLLQDWRNDFSQANHIVDLAKLHYRFEKIHPLTDGNGRTGRMMNQLFLVQHDFLSLPILPLSRYLYQNRQDYYRLLHGDKLEPESWQEWIVFIVKGISQSARWAIKVAKDIVAWYRQVRQWCTEQHIALSPAELEAFFVSPVVNIKDLAINTSRQTMLKRCEQLVELGILSHDHAVSDKRNKWHSNQTLLNILQQP